MNGRSKNTSSEEMKEMRLELARQLGLQAIHPDARNAAVVAVNRLVQGSRDYGPPLAQGKCLIGQKTADNPGYIKLSVSLGSKTQYDHQVLLQQLLVELKHGQKWLTKMKARNLLCSHLCHNPLCVLPDHILMETAKANMRRVSCSRLGHCLGPLVRGHPDTRCVLPIPDQARIAEIVRELKGPTVVQADCDSSEEPMEIDEESESSSRSPEAPQESDEVICLDTSEDSS
jgi:Zinc-binding loop region of homing endonuclease